MKGTTGIRLRRESAKAMLEAQLKRGTKPEKINGKTTSNMVALTDADRKRIQQEIDNINNKKSSKTYA
jgi:malonyl CoA-acyl carrier protein transacylase